MWFIWFILWLAGSVPGYMLLCRALTYNEKTTWNNEDRIICIGVSLALSWIIIIVSLISLFVQMIGKPPNSLESFLEKHIVPFIKKLEPKIVPFIKKLEPKDLDKEK